ncbi:hypothetical protein HZA39_00870 [Candidatus Peregrinibacteria bacterium]|nr:hypothetical protein [Candidatus Peregrinibacteria bacterium]
MKKYLNISAPAVAKLKFTVLILGLALALTVLFGATSAFADEADIGAQTDQKAEECSAGMQKYFDAARPLYFQFIEQHYQNKSGNAGLIDTSIELYRQYKKKAYDKYETYYPTEGNFQIEEVQKQTACYEIVKKEVEDARSVLKTHAVSTAAVKKQTALIQKYQSINSQLRKLNISLAEFKGFIDSFENKLQKFVYKCLP